MTGAAREPPYTLPQPFRDSPIPLTLLTQGAEALIFRTTYLTPDTHCALKYRPSKPYRHPVLDKRLTRGRILAEARVLVRCRRMGVAVPRVIALDWEAGWLMLEWIAGLTIRACLDQFLHTLSLETEAEKTGELWDLMRRVGRAVGKMHEIGVVHGDLTTSNLMLRPPAQQDLEQGRSVDDKSLADAHSELAGDIILIDFGLAMQSVQDEDKAVDLYVLERAFSATHPAAEPLFKEVLHAYSESYKGAKVVLKRLDEVRLRGRKKSMIG